MAIRNLVFQGGGVKGSAYAGAVEVFDQAGLLDGVANVAGTSAGAITASLLAVGAGSAGLTQAVRSTDFGSFLDLGWCWLDEGVRLLAKYGVCAGDHFEALLGDQVARYGGDRDLTFAGLSRLVERDPARFANLFVIASNLNQQTAQVLCTASHPDMRIWEAVRMSMSLPFIFEPVSLGGHLYIDGGLSWNFPIDLFDHAPDARALAQPRGKNPRNLETVGFVLQPTEQAQEGVHNWSSPPAETGNLVEFAKAVMGYSSEVANRQHLHAADLPRTVFIDDLGIKTTDFKAPPAVIEALIASGSRAATAFLAARAAGLALTIPAAQVESPPAIAGGPS